MDLYVARQPIFDCSNEVFGYEILYRSGFKNIYDGNDPDYATINTIMTSIFNIGIDNLTVRKKAFINFTHNSLDKEIATILPNKYIVVEVLETVEPKENIIKALKRLKDDGYTIALDDFVFTKGYEPFIELADIIKIDFLLSTDEYKKEIFNYCKNYEITFLAEKIENESDYLLAKELGYKLFQGFYFGKPEILSKKIIELNKNKFHEIFKMVFKGELDLKNISFNEKNIGIV